MNGLASYAFCPTCAESTLHTSRGCCHHERPRESRPQPSLTRGHISHQLGRPRATDLTARERSVAELVAKGLTHKEIGLQLGLHRSSVSNAVKRACQRVGAQKTYELVRYVRDSETYARHASRLERAVEKARERST